MKTHIQFAKRGSSFLILSLVGFAFGACSSVSNGDEQVSSAEENLYYNRTDAHWPSTHPGSGMGADIPVCYKTTGAVAGSAEEAARVAYFGNVRNWIENTWGRVLDVNFDGWGRCDNATNGKLVVDIKNGGGSASNLGYQGPNAAAQMTLDYTDWRQILVAVHEFGHALGFEHEFKRPDRSWVGGATCNTDADCAGVAIDYGGHCGYINPGDTVKYCRNQEGDAIKLAGGADYESVMSATYFNNTIDSDRSGIADPQHVLSPFDIIGAQSIYGAKHTGSIVGLGGRCANIAADATVSGQPVIAYPCTGVNNDTFMFSGFTLLQTKVAPSTCLNVKGGSVGTGGTDLVSWDCNPGYTNENFEFSRVKLRAMGNMCVAATVTTSGTPTAGAALESIKCGLARNASRENWDLVAKSRGVLRLNGTNLCLTETKTTPSLGSKPTLQPCDDSESQNFIWSGSQISKSNMCLNVFGGTADEGRSVGWWDCGAFYNSSFYVSGPIHSLGQCVDMFGGQSYTGAQIGMYPCSGTPNEEWDWHF
jgi:hypothetical protein